MTDPTNRAAKTSRVRSALWFGALAIATIAAGSASTLAAGDYDSQRSLPGPSPSIAVAGTLLSSDDRELAELERRMLELINRDRLDPANNVETIRQLKPVQWDNRLAAVARAHSKDMAEKHYVAHEEPNGSLPVQPVQEARIQFSATGENIARYRDVDGAQAAFMDEPRFAENHRSNILDPGYTRAGIGIVRGPHGMLYITQEFVQDP